MHVCRQLYPNDSFWTISNEFTREKKNWLQDGTIQRRYAVWVFFFIFKGYSNQAFVQSGVGTTTTFLLSLSVCRLHRQRQVVVTIYFFQKTVVQNCTVQLMNMLSKFRDYLVTSDRNRLCSFFSDLRGPSFI